MAQNWHTKTLESALRDFFHWFIYFLAFLAAIGEGEEMVVHLVVIRNLKGPLSHELLTM